MHQNSLLMFRDYAQQYFKPESRILEIGPDAHPSTFLEMLGFTPERWDTLDIERAARPTYLLKEGEPWHLDGMYDIVFAAQVIEHVPKVWEFVGQCAAACKPGGLVVLICPVSWPYHEAPVDAWRIYPSAMNALFEHAGLTTVLTQWGSLEPCGRGVRFPGRSQTHVVEPELRKVYATNLATGGYVETAFDTIGIARK